MNDAFLSRIEELQAEIKRLRGMVHDDAVMLGEQGREIERLNGIVQFSETASRQQREGFQAEIETLKAVLREVVNMGHGQTPAECFTADDAAAMYDIARAALEGK